MARRTRFETDAPQHNAMPCDVRAQAERAPPPRTWVRIRADTVPPVSLRACATGDQLVFVRQEANPGQSSLLPYTAFRSTARKVDVVDLDEAIRNAMLPIGLPVGATPPWAPHDHRCSSATDTSTPGQFCPGGEPTGGELLGESPAIGRSPVAIVVDRIVQM